MGPRYDTIELSDGYAVHVRWWTPGSPIGSVLYLHGIESHGGWFEASASRLSQAGFAVLLPDRRGSGRNRVDRGHASSARRLLDDVYEQAQILQLRLPSGPVHLVGVSWGGKLAAAAVARAPNAFASLTLIAPGLFPQVDLRSADKVRVALAALTARRKEFEIPLKDPRLFTSNPARIEFIREDPLRIGLATASLLLASWRLDRWARRLGARQACCPVHLFLAGRDRIICNDRTRDFVRTLGGTKRSITEYGDVDHTLEFQSDPETFFSDLTTWLCTANRQVADQTGVCSCCPTS